MNDNQIDTMTPIEMHEHGSAEYRHAATPEPFPVISRDVRRYASDVGAPSILTHTLYSLGDHAPDAGTVSSAPLRRLDPALDKPMVLMIMTHPSGTDPDAVSATMHSMAYWRGCGSSTPMQWRIGEDRVWTLHQFRPIPGTHSHVIIRKGFRMTSVEGLDGIMDPWVYDMQIREHREKAGENVHWHRHYASDAPVPGTALHSTEVPTERQLEKWFARRLAVPLPDGTEQDVLGVEVTLEGAGGVAYSAIRRGPHVMAHRCRFAFSPGDIFDDTITWLASYESSGWDETVFPARLAVMLTPPVSPLAIGWRRRTWPVSVTFETPSA